MYLTAGGIQQRADVLNGGSYLSSNDLRVHFALGDANAVGAVEIHGPDCQVKVLALSGVDRIYKVEERKDVIGQLDEHVH